ncbi:cytochrome P450 family protein [Streptomyces bohaiensis]|uniref:Cytochrome P450 n=1 Tax=Streptomyces bohaiensis TaxID=1431344 RepID=A0ABX1C9H9_9ACTN|nr:cytochrome P450 [Streptomyces bohaiensis]NJQ15788.1 cytochrome P450 [Streptomyces bohaiensis]
MTAQASQGSGPYPLDGSGSDIHGEATALRDLGPAVRVLLPGDIPAWSVTDPGLIRRLLAHKEVSKDAHQHWPAYREGRVPEDWPLRIWVDVRNALAAFGTEHTRLRKPLAAAFTARRVRALEPQVQRMTDDLLDELRPDVADGTVDLRDQFAWRLPLLVVNALLGVPESLHDEFRDAIGTLFATDLSPEEAAAGGVETYRLLNELIELKTATPGDDVTSAIIAAHSEGSLDDQELRDSLLLLIGAGHETTVNLIDHGITNLLLHPEQRERAVNGEVSWDAVVEETLRHQAPIASIILRFAVNDLTDEVTGIHFAQGEAIVINYAAAGRDPAVHGESADAFDVSRAAAREHLAFGHGVHYCVGAPLARIEGRVALSTLFSRYPELTLAVAPEELQPLPSLISNGHQRLPVHLDAAAARRTSAA